VAINYRWPITLGSVGGSQAANANNLINIPGASATPGGLIIVALVVKGGNPGAVVWTWPAGWVVMNETTDIAARPLQWSIRYRISTGAEWPTINVVCNVIQPSSHVSVALDMIARVFLAAGGGMLNINALLATIAVPIGAVYGAPQNFRSYAFGGWIPGAGNAITAPPPGYSIIQQESDANGGAVIAFKDVVTDISDTPGNYTMDGTVRSLGHAEDDSAIEPMVFTQAAGGINHQFATLNGLHGYEGLHDQYIWFEAGLNNNPATWTFASPMQVVPANNPLTGAYSYVLDHEALGAKGGDTVWFRANTTDGIYTVPDVVLNYVVGIDAPVVETRAAVVV
jgi:hypothetical protein